MSADRVQTDGLSVGPAPLGADEEIRALQRQVAAMQSLLLAKLGSEAPEVKLKVYQLTGRYRRHLMTSIPRTYRKVRVPQFRHLLRHAGRLDWSELTKTWVPRYQQARLAETSYRGGPPAHATINGEIRTLFSMLNWYLGRDEAPSIPRNPLKGWRPLRVMNVRDFHVPAHDVPVFLQAAHPILRMMVILSCEFGFRRGEVTALEWQEIDLENKRVTLREWKVKDKESRHIIISDLAAEVLRLAPRYIPSDYVFPNPRTGDGAPIPEGTVYDWFKKARARSGILGPKGPDGNRLPVWFHSFRKSWASFMASRGMPQLLLREQGGWSDEETAKLYKQFDPSYAAESLRYMNANPMSDAILALLKGKPQTRAPGAPAGEVPHGT